MEKQLSIKNETLWTKFVHSNEFGVLVPLVVLVILTGLVNADFLTVGNFTTILKNVPFQGICALGIMFVLITGKVDISVGRVAGLAGMIFPFCMMRLNMPILPSIIIALAVGAAFGLLNGFLIVKVGMPDFVATIGTLYIAGGLRFLLTAGYPLTDLPFDLGAWGDQVVLGVSWPFWIMIGLFIIVAFVLKKTLWGRHLLATGDNQEVAALAGIKTVKVRMTAHMLCSIFAAAAGILLTIDANNGLPQSGDGWEFRAIAACAVGGVSLSGGKGSAIGVLIGVLLLYILENALIMMGIPSTMQKAVNGAVLAVAVLFDMYKQNRKIKA
ncbi:MAG: ABC transporter permease [Christensenella sp.]|uniref:ABC transporter permease n=1 Tax=Christensenella sp. TaxID=1935934 RepID=UPI002B1FBA6E|nr:ABC transporter permease [Christensenella sp.]MEA5002994.1 ABC transporter permease [Christensenella sp.]